MKNINLAFCIDSISFEKGFFSGQRKKCPEGYCTVKHSRHTSFLCQGTWTVIVSVQTTSISLSTYTVFVNIVLDLSQSMVCRSYPYADKAGKDCCPIRPIGKFRPKELNGLSSGCWRHLWRSRELKSLQVTDQHVVREMCLLSKFT